MRNTSVPTVLEIFKGEPPFLKAAVTRSWSIEGIESKNDCRSWSRLNTDRHQWNLEPPNSLCVFFSNFAISSLSASSGSGSSAHLSFANMTSSRDVRKDFFDSSRGPDEILGLRLYYKVKSIVQVKKKRKRKQLTLVGMRFNRKPNQRFTCILHQSSQSSWRN
jgi:hypothetical protein